MPELTDVRRARSDLRATDTNTILQISSDWPGIHAIQARFRPFPTDGSSQYPAGVDSSQDPFLFRAFRSLPAEKVLDLRISRCWNGADFVANKH